jgi:hypothetical protein
LLIKAGAIFAVKTKIVQSVWLCEREEERKVEL